MPHIDRRALLGGLAFASFAGTAPLRASAREADRWTGAWASAQMIPNPDTALPADFTADVTLRQIVRVTLGGRRLRVRLSNVFGTKPLTITAAHVAPSTDQMTSGIDASRGHHLTFGGQPGVTLPAGAEYTSDPVDLSVKAFDDLAISMHFSDASAPQTSHPGARMVSYLANGPRVADPDLEGAAEETRHIERWFYLSGVDVEAAPASAAIVALGDSITDGYGVKPGANARWTDTLAGRLQAGANTRHLSVLNAGIGGGRILMDGSGPSAMARYERDVLSQSGVKYLILLEGVNDLGVLTRDAPVSDGTHTALVDALILATQQMSRRARERGIRMIGGTILPFTGSAYYHPDARNEADRQRFNQWIRTSSAFDAVIDFDKIMADPADPKRLRPEYDSGDHLHPSMAGYNVMGEAVDLRLFR